MNRRTMLTGALLALSFGGSCVASFAGEPEKLWVKEFPVYANAVELCSDCVMAGPGKGGITFTKYTSSDAPDKVLQFYRNRYKTAGDSFKDSTGNKSLSVDAVGGKNQPSCTKEKKPPAAAKSVIVVSVKTPGPKTK